MAPGVYKLSASLRGHEDDVRGVAFPTPSSVISASRDATVRLWTTAPNSNTFSEHINTTGSGFINCVTYMQPTAEHPKGLIVSGGKEAIIEVREPESEKPDPDYLLLGHTSNVCTLDTLGDIIVSGSWDGTARVWKNWETQYVLEGHEGSVWAVLVLSSTEIITGGADQTIRFWRNGKQVAVLKGHTDCVRGLCRLPNGLFASCANDATIRIWSADGIELQELHDHTNYIYSIAALPSGEIVSSGEDRTVRVWKDGNCVQTITHPAISVWSVAACPETGDIVSGASDNIVRVFSRDEGRWATQELLNEFEESIAASNIPSNQVGDIQKDKLPGVEALQKAGTKDGQVIMVRSGEKVEAYMWSAAERGWTNVGTVVDAVGSGRKRMYDGKEYDFVFDVDIQEGKPPLKLPYNASQNPFDAARKFLEDNELPISYLDTVGNFIVQNSQGVSIGQQSASSNTWDAAPEPQKQPRFLPHSEYLTITTANLAIIQKKIGEFNQGLINDGQKDVSLNPQELSTLSGLGEFIQTAGGKPASASSPVTTQGLEILVKIFSTWPVQQRLPALDLLRLLTAVAPAPAEYELDGKDLVSLLRESGSVSSQQINNTMLAVRAFVNMFQTPAGKKLVSSRYEEILGLVKTAAADTTNRNLKVAEATLLLNYAVLFRAENSPEKVISIIERLCNLIKSESDAETAFRCLVALGTALTMGEEVQGVAGVYGAKGVAVNAMQRIKENRIAQIVEDIQLLI